IGVMPPGFRHPDARLSSPVEFWAPCGFSAEPFPEQKRQFRFLELIGRLRPGVDVAQAQAALGTVQERLKGQYAESYGGGADAGGGGPAPLGGGGGGWSWAAGAARPGGGVVRTVSVV